MKRHNSQPQERRQNELWLVEHPPVFTLGLAARKEHLLAAGEIPVVKTDRGGQVTYHGPGQLMLYLLLNLRPRQLSVRALVTRLEQTVINLLAHYDLSSQRRDAAPGVYVDGAKIAALGLRIRNGASYHGLSFNYAMSLAPYQGINPCGYPDLAVTQLADLIAPLPPRGEIETQLAEGLAEQLQMELVTLE